MASKSITLVVQPRGKPIRNLPKETSLPLSSSTQDLYEEIASSAHTSIHRLRITKGSDGSHVPPSKDTTLESTGLRDNSTVSVKDLGPQIPWRTVFIVEYLGPILIHPLIFFFRNQIYTSPPYNWYYRRATVPFPSDLQTLSLALVLLHFLKREFETMFVHRFSLATMPARNIFKNSGHYWVFSGLLLAYFTYAPDSPTQTGSITSPLTILGVLLFIIGEAGNLNAHLVLRDLRREGTTERGIPRGIGFGLVTCPNYMFETIAWLGIWAVNRSLSTVVFLVLAVAQMASWALKKERRYRKEFPETYKKKRFAMLPGIV